MPKKPASEKQIESFVHDDASRRNIPPAEYQTMVRNQEKTPLQVAYERRNPDLDPQLIWRGKDLLDDSPLVVNAPPLYIQEKIHPKVLIDDLKRRSKQGEGDVEQIDLFSAFNGLPSEEAKTEFYQHDQNWSNRMILGDSLQVMASLAEREELRGKVQCIYFDPPYGIKFNSNFQWSTTSRDVKDGNASHITREPEQVKAFRDTWRDGIHSYLGYLRDRLVAARDLLADSGSIFAQIGDGNVHRVRALLDEVFGEDCFVTEILVKKKGSQKGGTLDSVNDFLLWYGKQPKTSGKIKVRPVYEIRTPDEMFEDFPFAELPDGTRARITELEKRDSRSYIGDIKALENAYPGVKLFAANPLKSGGNRRQQSHPFVHHGRTFPIKAGQCWKHTVIQSDGSTPGMTRLSLANRLLPQKNDVRFVRHAPIPPIREISNWWDGFGGASNPVYVVQTNERIVERVLLLTTDPGDIVLDITCGSGTTPVAAEKWGRRWIAVDTSRVALALARSRVMSQIFPYFILRDSKEGYSKEVSPVISASPPSFFGNKIQLGFACERAFNVTSGSIANNSEIEIIWNKWQDKLKPLREQLNAELGASMEEWEIPHETQANWSTLAQQIHSGWLTAYSGRQKEIEASISSKADYEYLYDKPYEDKTKVRVAGPFTVESLSPHRTMIVNDDDTITDPLKQGATAEGATDFAQMILNTLRVAGVQQAHKQDRISFESLDGWPGELLAGKGSYRDADGALRTAGIFIGPEFGTVTRVDLVEAARECADAGFNVLISCAFNYEAQSTEFDKLGPIPVLKARMNADLHMQQDLANSGKGNLFVIFGEPDIDILDAPDDQIQVKINGVDVFDPSTGEVRSDEPDNIACWFIDSDYNGESFFVRQAYFLGQNDPYKSLKTSLKAEIDSDAWESLNSDMSVPFAKPSTGRIAVKVINHLGDEVMKVYRVA
jgi:adenine-specific DNA-methyltransferase